VRLRAAGPALGCLTLLALLLGCTSSKPVARPSGSSNSGPAPSSASTPESRDIVVVDGSEPATLDTKDALSAQGHISVVRTVTGRLKNGGTRGVRAVGDSGSLLIAASPAAVTGGVLPVIGQSTMELWGPSSRRVISDGSTTGKGQPSQTYAAHLCGSPPVWMETHSVELERADWRAWARLPGSKSPTLLGSSDKLVPRKDPPPPPDEGNLAASSSMAYWPITIPGGDGWHAAIAGARLAPGTKARVVVADALYPQVVESALLYVREPRVDRSMPATTFEIRRHGGDQDSLVIAGRLQRGSAVEAFAATSGRYAVAVSDPPRGASGLADKAVLAVWGAGIDGVIRIRLHDHAVALSMSGDLLTWGNGSGNYDGGQYVFDLRGRSLYKVHSNKGGSYIRTCNGYIGWTDFPDVPQPAANFVVARWR
jgi:hypothetical protein